MVGRRELGSWLEGPGRGTPAQEGGYPGRRLGLPETGPGSVAGFGRRLVALGIDWGASLLIAGAFLQSLGWGSFAPLVVFLVEHLLLVGTLGYTVGHRLLGLRVAPVPGGRARPQAALIRTLLLGLAVPALIWDRDQRGLHDRAAGTVVVRT